MIAATTPPRTDGTTTVFTISHRVAPSPIEPSSSSRRHTDEELAADRRGDRDGHDRQHDDRGEHRRLGLVGSPPKIGIQPKHRMEHGCDVLRVERRRARRSPRDRSRRDGTAASMSISVPTGAADRRRRELAQEEADRDRERRGSSIAPNDVTTVPMIRSRAPNWFSVRVPLVVPDEAEPEELDRRPGAVGDAPDDREDDEDAEDRGERGQAVEQPVADAVADVPRARRARRRDRTRLPRAPAFQRRRPRRRSGHHFDTRRSHAVYPAPANASGDSRVSTMDSRTIAASAIGVAHRLRAIRAARSSSTSTT